MRVGKPGSRRKRLIARYLLWSVLAAAGAGAVVLLLDRDAPEEYSPGGAVSGITSDLHRGLPSDRPQLRFTDAKPWLRTMAPCVTPKHEWIVSRRMAPLTGRECLDLQGIPISDRVSQMFDDAQLRDLAGNAMSTTVVAAACLAALVSYNVVETDDGRAI